MKSSEERHNEFLSYRAYCEEFLSHKRRSHLFARWMPVKRVSCNCGCGEYWMDDLSDTNWLSQMLSIKSFFVLLYHLHQAVKGLHGVVWFAAPLCWTCATQSSKEATLLAYSGKDVERLVSPVGRIGFLIVAIFCWNLSRLGGSFFLAGFLVALAIGWATLSLALVLNAAMLLPFATSLIIGLAAGYFLEDRWWIAVLCVSIGTIFQFLQYRRVERKRRTELGRVLAVATGEIIPDTDKPARVKTHAEVRAERSLASAAEPVFQDDVQAWLHLVKTGPTAPPDLNAYPDTLLGTARYITDHEIYWEHCDEARAAANAQNISTVRFAINKLKDEWAIPHDEIVRLRSRAKWLTIDDTRYAGRRRPLYPAGWENCDPDDTIARLRQLSKLLEHRDY